jgi:hypothetical protein
MQTSIAWSTAYRTTVREDIQTDENNPALPTYDYGYGNLVDAWCESTTRVEVIYIGTGEVKHEKTYNAASCQLPPCGLSITSVEVTGADMSGPNATATVYTNGGGGTLEYSLNNFIDSLASNIFTGLTIGQYIAYARPVDNRKCAVQYPFEVKPNWQVRWRMEYKTSDGISAKVEIEDRSWTGAVEELTGSGNPVKLEYPAIGNKYDLLGGSGLSLEFIVKREGLLTDMYTADERKFRVNLYENNTLKWRGYVLPEWYAEPWISVDSKPYVTLVAGDGLAALQDVYYVVENGLRYYGRETQLNVLKNCLDKLDLELPFYTAVNVWSENMDTTLDPLGQAYVEQSGYYDDTTPLSCGEVLERILNPYVCFIRQAEGAIHIIPHHARKDVYVRRKYSYKGVFELTESFQQVDDITRHGAVSYRQGEQIINVLPAITLGRTILEYGELKNFVENGHFEDWSAGVPVNWEGDAQVQKALTEEGDAFRLQLSTASDLQRPDTGG